MHGYALTVRRVAVLLWVLVIGGTVAAEAPATLEQAAQALQSEALATRQEAIRWLATQGRAGVSALSAHLSRETDLELLRAMLGILANAQDPRAVPALRELVRHEDLSIRTTALTVVARLDRRAGRDLAMQVLRSPRDNDPAWKERSAALLVLAELGDREAFFLIAEAYREGGGAKRWLARACFAKLIGALRPSDAVRRLVPLLADEDARVAATAGKALYDVGPDGRAALTKLLSHEVPRVRIAALAGFHDALPQGVDARIRSMTRVDPDRGVRWAATQVLWRVEDPAADELVLEATRAQEHALRVTAFALLEQRLRADHGTNLTAWRKALADWRAGRK